jgi:hypothetical protein
MDRHTFLVISAIGALLYGALYLTGVFAAAILTHNAMAGLLAIGAAGTTYLCFALHLDNERLLGNLAAGVSVVCAMIAGGWLLVP